MVLKGRNPVPVPAMGAEADEEQCEPSLAATTGKNGEVSPCCRRTKQQLMRPETGTFSFLMQSAPVAPKSQIPRRQYTEPTFTQTNLVNMRGMHSGLDLGGMARPDEPASANWLMERKDGRGERTGVELFYHGVECLEMEIVGLTSIEY